MQATPFHSGERAIQERLGVRAQIEAFARQVVRPHMPEQHREFYQNLPFLVAAARDSGGRPWATLLAGTPGFVSTPDARSLEIAARPVSGDALADSFSPGADVGLLGIEFATRRRNRVNGRIVPTTQTGVRIAVDQSFGNCPQYIQTRSIEPRQFAVAQTAAGVERTETLTDEIVAFIEHADTFFISSRTNRFSARASSGIDASHRGGRPGFVRAGADGVLSFPDFSGNRLFNTLGNIADDGRVGMLFADFDAGDLLLLTGRASIVWDGDRLDGFAGAQRLVDVKPAEFVLARSALPLAGRLIEQSPKLAATGTWQQGA